MMLPAQKWCQPLRVDQYTALLSSHNIFDASICRGFLAHDTGLLSQDTTKRQDVRASQLCLDMTKLSNNEKECLPTSMAAYLSVELPMSLERVPKRPSASSKHSTASVALAS